MSSVADPAKANTAPIDNTTTSKPASVQPTAKPTDPTAATTSGDGKATGESSKSRLSRMKSGKKFVTAYAKTVVGLSPLWLMGEAVTGKKVGGQFKSGRKELVKAAIELREGLITDAKDVVVIVDKGLQDGKDETAKTAEILKEAGKDAILVVSTSLEKAQAQISASTPQLKASLLSHSKDAIIIVDGALKNPIVITGITKFAQTKGIPYSQAMIQVASLAVSKVLKIVTEEAELANKEVEVLKGKAKEAEIRIQELDVNELERSATSEDREQSAKIGQVYVEQAAKVDAGETSLAPEGKGKGHDKKDSCIIM